MAARRLIVVLLALLVVSSIAAALAPVRPSEDDEETTEITTPATPSPGKLVRRTIGVGAERPATIALELGDQLALTVTSDRLAEIEIPGLGELDAAHPDAPARFDLLPRTPGTYEMRLLDSGRRLGSIEVSPRGEPRSRERSAKRPERDSSARNDSGGGP